MSGEETPAMETSDRPEAEHAQLGLGFWVLWILGLTVVGALSCRIGAVPALTHLALEPVALLLFGILAGIVQWFALRRHGPPLKWWILASSLAGLLAACISYFTVFLGVVATQSSVGLLAGWAYAWVAYGGVLGVMLQHVLPGRRAMLACLVGWAMAGIVGGAVAWARDVVLVRPNNFVPYPSLSLTSSVEDIILVGAVYGLTGGVITGTILAWQFRQPVLPGGGAGRKVKARSKDTGLVAIAGSVSGLLAAAMCAYLTPLLLWVRAGLGLGLADLTDLFSAILSDSVLCIPAVSALSIPLGIGGGYAGLLIARARGKPSPSPWIWGGSIVGGTIGYVVSSLLTAAVLRR